MSTTTIAGEPLAEILRRRWEDADHDNVTGVGDDVVSDALFTLREALIDYRVYATSATGEAVALAADWIDPLEQAIEQAGQAAWREHVVPAVAAAIVERLPDAPHWLRMHPESEQLRADLATLEVAS